MADNRSGIYRIVHMESMHEYVGSAITFRKRWNIHKRDLRLGQHHSTYLQRAYDKYGLDAFAFVPIEIVTTADQLISREQYWIDELQPVFNMSRVAGSTLGVPCSSETRAKIGAANTGKTGYRHTDETKAVLSAAKIGNQHTKGRVMPEDERKRRGESQKGRVMSAESRQKISDARTGQPGRVWTDESREKLAESKRGVPRPPHVIQAMNEGRRFKRETLKTALLDESI